MNQDREQLAALAEKPETPCRCKRSEEAVEIIYRLVGKRDPKTLSVMLAVLSGMKDLSIDDERATVVAIEFLLKDLDLINGKKEKQ